MCGCSSYNGTMLTIRALHYQQGGHPLLTDVALEIFRGERIGLVGRNGCGKSTLLRLIAGTIEPDQGEVNRHTGITIAQVEQELSTSARSVLDFTLDGDVELRALESVIGDGATVDKRYFEAQARFEEIAGFAAPARAAQLLSGLGFANADLNRPVSVLSGGWRMRLNLARALMRRADLLLLDEPTNHLDLEAIAWLEQYLARYDGAIILVSHDRDFLNAVVNRIAHIEHGALTVYTGRYDDYEARRAQALATQEAAHARQQERIAELERFVTRFRAKASKARQAQSRLKMLERMTRIAEVQADSSYTLRLESPDRAPQTLLALRGTSFAYGDGSPLFQKVNLTIGPGDRVAVVGPNGAGKSTFLKLLVGILAPQEGEAERGPGVAVGYFAQHQLEQLDPAHTPLTYLACLDSKAQAQTLRNYLGRFGFGATTMDRAVGTFSGGEKSRLVLAGLAWLRPHVLVLDEPTNHLDLEMRDALMLALQDYTGALVLVSHDRHLIRGCVDTLWLVADGQAQVFDGDLADYQRFALARQGAATMLPETRHPAKPRSASAALKAKAAQQKKLETEIAKIEMRLKEIDRELTDPLLYQRAADQARRLVAERQALQARHESSEALWLALEEN